MKRYTLTLAVAMAAACTQLSGCGGGGGDDPPIEAQTFRLNVLPWTSTYAGQIEVCPAPWQAPRHMVLGATLDYAPTKDMVVYRNLRAIDSFPFAVYEGDWIYVCAKMQAPLTILWGEATLTEVPYE